MRGSNHYQEKVDIAARKGVRFLGYKLTFKYMLSKRNQVKVNITAHKRGYKVFSLLFTIYIYIYNALLLGKLLLLLFIKGYMCLYTVVL